MAARGPKSVRNTDAHVGARIRERRVGLGMTQQDLARGLGVAYQQQQKYETGTNRISASRLYDLAAMLDVDVTYFFKGAAPTGDRSHLPHGGTDRATIEFVRNFQQIPDRATSAAVAGLVKALIGAKRRQD